jgi:hypothetical protein
VGERRFRVGVGSEEAVMARKRRWSGSGSREWASVVRKGQSRAGVDEGAAKLMAGVRTTPIVAL